MRCHAAILVLALRGVTAATYESAECAKAVDAAGKNASSIAACLTTCLAAADTKVGANWELAELGNATCTACVNKLQECVVVATSGFVGPAGFKTDVSSSGMKCIGKVAWSNATYNASFTEQLRLQDLCFPTQCSNDDVMAIFKELGVAFPVRSHIDYKATCDIFASFVDGAVAWFVLGGSLVLVIVTAIVAKVCGHSRRVTKYLMTMLWLIDFVIGVTFTVLGLVLLAQKNFPSYLPITIGALGVYLLLIALLIYCGTKGTSCLLQCVYVFSLLLGIVSWVAGIALQIAGKELLETALKTAGVALNNEDREALQDFMHVAHTLLVCVFFVVGGVQFSSVVLAPKIKENNIAAKDEEKYAEENKVVADADRRDKGASAFADKARKKVEKEQAAEKKRKDKELKSYRP